MPNTRVNTGYTVPNKSDIAHALMELARHWGEGMLETANK